ncbi:MAG TPA: peroxidase family protein [Rubrobacter sp.]|nr:peroxidase family protein [Rubrobacter sp.]
MSRFTGTRGWHRHLSPLSVTTLAALGLLWLAYISRTPLLARLSTWATETSRWSRLPVPLGLATILIYRNRLRQQNLYDTESPAAQRQPVPKPPGARHLIARTADGTYNDLQNPRMGSAETRFGRNVPLDRTYPDYDRLLQPNPRTVSRELLTRETFQPAESLNLLAATWIQFMLRDWVSHGTSPTGNPWEVPLEDEDRWPEHPMRIFRTPEGPSPTPEEEGMPPTHINFHSHWWDGSQIYGNDDTAQAHVRSGEHGKLKIGPDGLIPVDPNSKKHPADEPGFWIGLVMMHTLFTREHNAICDRLRAEYPSWSDDDLFDRARLINTALMAKIHTIEWTPALLKHPTARVGLNANWWGLAGKTVKRLVGRISENEVISGIVGGRRDHFGVPYSLTEEFVSVYRMHPLIPDDYTFRAVASDEVLQEREFAQVAQRPAMELMDQVDMEDLFYSFGVAHPGAITLHNYPNGLQNFQRPGGIHQDLAATDIFRSRELGVPRYNEFRRLLHLKPIKSFEDLTDKPEWVRELRRVYNDDVEQLDQMIGMYAENPPDGFAFSDTAFRIFVLMASRRLNSDRFLTTDYNEQVYTRAGIEWVNETDMSTVLLRHYPALAPSMRNVKNAFWPWTRVGS